MITPPPAPEPQPAAPVEIPSYSDGVIDQVLSRRVCARCYNDLRKAPAPNRMWYAHCPTCGASWQGATVSRKYAESLGQRALAEYYEVKYNPALRDVFGDQQKQTEAEILKSLGFGG